MTKKRKDLSREAAGLDKPITPEKIKARKNIRSQAAGMTPRKAMAKKK